MSTAELNTIKLNLIDWINHLSDNDLIVFLDGLRISNVKTDWWDNLSASQKEEIQAGLKDAESGYVMEKKVFWEKFKNG